MIRLAILGSTRGTNMLAMIDAIKQNRLSASIEIVVSNKSDAQILARAKSFGLKAEFVDPTGLSREQYDEKVSELLHQYHIDLIVLIGYMRIISPSFISAWEHKIINVHPSLLPAHAGLMDLNVHKAVLQAGDNQTGCTVHYVTEQVDAGPIILQKKCQVMTGDTPESLKERVQNLEGDALIEAIQHISNLGARGTQEDNATS